MTNEQKLKAQICLAYGLTYEEISEIEITNNSNDFEFDLKVNKHYPTLKITFFNGNTLTILGITINETKIDPIKKNICKTIEEIIKNYNKYILNCKMTISYIYLNEITIKR